MYYEPFLKNKNKTLVKPSEIITQQPNTLENRNIIKVKSVTIKHPETSQKLF